MERETNLPPLHLPALNFLKIWHSALRCVCVHMCACACLRVCVWNPKNLNLRNEALYYENIPRCLWQRFLSAVDSSLLSKEWHRWEAVRFHSALATSLMSMNIWHSECACVCVCSCVPVWVWMPPWLWVCACTACLERPEDNIGSFLRGLSHVVGDQVSHWPGTSQKRERPD